MNFPQKEETAGKPVNFGREKACLSPPGQKEKATGSEWRYVGGCLLYLETTGGGHGVGIRV